MTVTNNESKESSYPELLRQCDRDFTALTKTVDRLVAFTTYGARKEYIEHLLQQLSATAVVLDHLISLD